MSFIAYKVKDYNHTAEREQYRALCEGLKKVYSKRKEMCLFIANYNFNGCEYDGIIVKNDAVFPVEFKNYGGTIEAPENGEWTADGVVIKGGTGDKTPYDQIRTNRSKLWNGLPRYGYLPKSQLVYMSAIIVFNEPIYLKSSPGGTVKSWLHIVDNDHFSQKVADITSPGTELSNDDILYMISNMGLKDKWLDKEHTNFEVDEIEEDNPIILNCPCAPSAQESHENVCNSPQPEPEIVQIPYGTLPEMSPKYIFKVQSKGITYKYGDAEVMVPKTKSKTTRMIWTSEGLKIKTAKTSFEVVVGEDVKECTDTVLIPWCETVVKLKKSDSEFAEIQISRTSDESLWREFKGNIANAAQCFAADVDEQNQQLHRYLLTSYNPLESYRLICSSIDELEKYHKGGYVSDKIYKENVMKWRYLKYKTACRLSAQSKVMNELSEMEKQEVLTGILQYAKYLQS